MLCKTIRGLLVALAALLLSAAAQAQLFRAYLSASGSDSNPCTLISPCRLLPAALNAVVSGGEIWMIDSANYNVATVSVGKSVSILAVPGVVGSVVAMGGPAIAIGASGLSVALRNLVIVPFIGGSGTNGVELTGASSLVIERSLIANLPNNGVYVSGTGRVKIANSIIRNNSAWAVRLEDGAAGAISGTQLLANDGGVLAQSTLLTTSTAEVADSVISGGSLGVVAYGSGGGTAKAFVTRCTIENTSTYALVSQTEPSGLAAVLAVSSSMITNNAVPWNQSGTGSVIRSLGNNHIADNASPPVGSLTPTALQ